MIRSASVLLLLVVCLAGCELVGSDASSAFHGKDDSRLSDSLRAQYRTDAAVLTLRRVQEEIPFDEQDAELPPEWIERFYGALIAVHNASSRMASAADVEGFHTWPNDGVYYLSIGVDSTEGWVQEWQQGRLLTGNARVDELLRAYDLTLDGLWNSYRQTVAYLRSERPLNTPKVASFFEGIPGVDFAQQGGSWGPDAGIVAKVGDGYVELTYTVGWGDCPSGCINRHWWVFRVYDSGAVQFMKEDGQPLPLTSGGQW